jgi:hypothetical protein
MDNEYVIRESRKTGIISREHYIVTLGDVVCLRLLDDGPKFAVVTATAGEDNKRFRAACNQELLIEVARKTETSEALGGKFWMHRDNYGRDYVQICRIENKEDLNRVIETFDRICETVNGYQQAESEAKNELRELYDVIAPDESGEDVYLQDGVWLSSDGKTKDSGR